MSHRHKWAWLKTTYNAAGGKPFSLQFVCPCGAYTEKLAYQVESSDEA